MDPASFISAAVLATAGNPAPSTAVKDAWSAVREYFYLKSARLTKIVTDLESGTPSEVRKLVLCEELEKFRVFSDSNFLALATKLETALKASPAPAPSRAPAATPAPAPAPTPAAPTPAPAPEPELELNLAADAQSPPAAVENTAAQGTSA